MSAPNPIGAPDAAELPLLSSKSVPIIDRIRDVFLARPPWLPAFVGVAAIAIAVTILAMWSLFEAEVAAEDRLPFVSSPPVSLTTPEVVVHLSGQVVTPGVYRLAPGARVIDLVDRAGGSLPAADLERMNLAAVVLDGDRIHLPAVGEDDLPDAVSIAGSTEATAMVDINRANLADLEALPGIGPSLAAAIIDDRDRLGAFASVDDLTRVSGIGPATVLRLRADAEAR